MKLGWNILVWAFIVANVQVAISQKRNSNEQVNINRYIDINSIPFLNRGKILKPSFKWDMSGEVQVAMNEGLDYLDKGSVPIADSCFKKVIKLNSSIWPAYYYYGLTQILLGKPMEAEKNLKQAIKLNPDIWESHILLGESYEYRRNYDKAESEYKKASGISSTNVYGIYKLGNLELQKRSLTKAEKYYQQCTKINPSFPDAFMAFGIIKILEKKDEAEALPFFEMAIKADSTFSGVYFWRGYVYLKQKEVAKCEKDWVVFLRYNPDNPFIMNTLGFLNIELNDFDQAFSYFKKALQAHPIDQNRFQSKETMLDKQIDIRFAVDYIIKQGYGLSDSAFTNLKKGFCLLLADKKKSALRSLKQSASFEKSSVEYFVEAITWEHLNEHDSAFAYYNKTIELDKDVFDAYKKRSIYLTALKDWKGAYRDFAEMHRLQPNSEVVYRLRGLAKYNLKDYYGSIIDLTKSLSFDSLNIEALTTRAECRKLVGDLKGENDDLRFILKYINIQGENRFAIGERIANNCLTLGDTACVIEMISQLPQKNTIESNIKLIKLYLSVKDWRNANEKIDNTIEDIEKKYKVELFGLEQLQKADPTLYNRDKMIIDLKSKLLVMPNNLSKLLYLKGIINFKKGETNESIKSFTNSLSKDPNNNEARYFRAQAYIKTGDNRKAINDLIPLKSQNYKDAEKLLESLTKD